ncbi:hypothetical protein FGO68_gene13157 [Halteria grandinella]|uniref:Uncharacterized protein n=1 Tax=Halteria grandinella TaxID=5974 RepID=A0A8J8NVT6_HALGN|nr:hypothetical protein FGO68_gene13157 [Halteria grandinella]
MEVKQYRGYILGKLKSKYLILHILSESLSRSEAFAILSSTNTSFRRIINENPSMVMNILRQLKSKPYQILSILSNISNDIRICKVTIWKLKCNRISSMKSQNLL